MTFLKLKGKIYQYFGINLACKEENDYLTSDEFWKEFNRIQKKQNKLKNNRDKLSNQTIQGILLGRWESEHGFYTFFVWGRFKRIRNFFKTLSFDLKRLLKK